MTVALRSLAVLLLGAVCAMPVRAETIRLADGTPITIRLLQELKSGRNKQGEAVRLRAAERISAQGQALVEAGAQASGMVTQSKGAKMLGKAGKIDFDARWVEAVDGSRIALRSVINKKGKSSEAWVIGATILLAWPAMFFRGSNITVPEGFEFIAYVDGNFEVKAPPPGAAQHPQAEGTGQAAALPANLQSLSVSDVTALRLDDKKSLVAFYAENPNGGVGLQNALVTLSAMDDNGNLVGTNASLKMYEPEKTIYWLGPRQRQLFVKQINVSGGYARIVAHVSESWVPWREEPPKVTVISTGLKGDKIIGEVRNESGATTSIEVAAVAKESGKIVAAACGTVEKVPAGQSKTFSLSVAGVVPAGAMLEATALAAK